MLREHATDALFPHKYLQKNGIFDLLTNMVKKTLLILVNFRLSTGQRKGLDGLPAWCRRQGMYEYFERFFGRR